MRLQSVVKAICSRKTRLEIQTDHQSFSNSAQKAANQVLRSIGCECLTFELMQVDVTGPIAAGTTGEWALRRNSPWRGGRPAARSPDFE